MSRKPAYLADRFIAAGYRRIRCAICNAIISSNAFAREKHRRQCQYEAPSPNASR